MTGAYVGVVLFYFVCPFVGAGARGCVVDTVGNGGDSNLQVLGCWPTKLIVFWASDLH